MRKIWSVLLAFVLSVVLCGCSDTSSVIRIHIRANSNLKSDQEVKMAVRDGVINYITPIIASCNNSKEVKLALSENLLGIEMVADEILSDWGFEYLSNAEIRNEYFPTRDYDGTTFPADYYDALILELGEAKGDNWWCVAYPPLCFVGEDVEGSQIRYKSKLLELINKFFG
ncbi:MAG: stage II sporulation protein R [Clostridia bacterium]|nr:stage II sporulation protein R [Clostridia bacterium]